MSKHLFTSESVTEGHPDKIADQISDAVLDAILAKDPFGRVACETMVTTGLVLVAGEISTKCYVEIPKIARQTIHDVGYDDATYGFDSKACAVLTAIDEQSTDIALGVDKGGAGDQGMMIGYAINETPHLMPLPIMLAHQMASRLAYVRKKNSLTYLRPDGKTQVTIEYENGTPKRLHTVVVSTQHDPHIAQKKIREDIIEHIIQPICGKYLDKKTIFHINPTGQFIIGGPPGDCGLTGRKIIVDTYGAAAHHGGGCFSGKDPSKVDRTAAYFARYVAKNVVGAGLAQRCEIQVSYAIGVAEPIALHINTFGTGKIDDERLIKMIKKTFDFRPLKMIEHLKLRRPIYKKTAAYGHFGREEKDFTWEQLDKVEELQGILQ